MLRGPMAYISISLVVLYTGTAMEDNWGGDGDETTDMREIEMTEATESVAGSVVPGARRAAVEERAAVATAALNTDGPEIGVGRQGDGKHKFCWLCRYQANRTTNEVVRFIMDAVPHMALDALVEQSKYILDKVDQESCCSLAQVRKHITEHMLHPRVKLALQLQDMARMQQEVSKCCVVSDVETGEKTVNTQAMRVYLTLCNQVVGVYKVGEERLTFNNTGIDK